jgi:hypothetical protein
MVAQVEPSAALEELRRRCSSKRKSLHDAAVRQKRFREILQFCAGVLALLSGLVSSLSGLVSSDLVEWTNSALFVKGLSAFLAFASGVISLYVSTYNRKKDVGAMFKGAAAFLSIRSKILYVHQKANNEEQLSFALKKLNSRYNKISKKYDCYLSKLPGERI